jgi:hypothetical protein
VSYLTCTSPSIVALESVSTNHDDLPILGVVVFPVGWVEYRIRLVRA